MKMLKEGQRAPDFSLKDSEGKFVRLSDFKGKKVLLYFYPKDGTPGCTKQACNLRDNYEILKRANIMIMGISLDDEKSHKNFIDKYDLPFILLCDAKKEVSTKYGVYGKKKFMGKEYFGINRTSFLINEKGKIEKIFKKVDVNNHANQVLGE